MEYAAATINTTLPLTYPRLLSEGAVETLTVLTPVYVRPVSSQYFCVAGVRTYLLAKKRLPERHKINAYQIAPDVPDEEIRNLALCDVILPHLTHSYDSAETRRQIADILSSVPSGTLIKIFNPDVIHSEIGVRFGSDADKPIRNPERVLKNIIRKAS